MENNLTQKLADYKPSEAAIKLINDTPVLLLVGPTGAGKDSLKDKLMPTGKYHHIVSHTTRPPRINHGIPEKNGADYHFIDMAEAEKMLDDKAFIEAKTYAGNLYGTSVAEIQAAHDEKKIAMTDVEVKGVAEYKQLDPGVIAVFLLPPDFKTWQERLKRRYGDVVDAADHRLRLETGLDELNELLTNDYYVAVINNDLEKTFQQVETIVSSPENADPDDEAARAVAAQFAKDIRMYLDQG